MGNKFKFSIVMSIYNVEKYINEAIDSILNQDIGFIENVQLVLVNDGSRDGCDKICMQYKEKYPNNIIYIKKENGGLASARNVGVKHCEGKYINFSDPDDTLPKNTLKEVYKFFEKFYNQVEFVTLPLCFFEMKEGLHPKYKYMGNKSRIINLDTEPFNFILSSAATFYKKELFDVQQFDEKMTVEEDTLFNFKLYEKNKCFGYVCDKGVKYNYRKRASGCSIVDNSKEKSCNYFSAIRLLETILSNYNEQETPVYIKELILYELRSRVKSITKDVFINEKEYFGVIEKFKKILSKVDKKHIAYTTKFLDTKELKYVFLSELNEYSNIYTLGENGYVQYENLNLFSISTLPISLNEIIYEKEAMIIDMIYYDYGIENMDVIIEDSEGIKYTSSEKEVFKSSYDKKYGNFVVSKTTRIKISVPYKSTNYSVLVINKSNRNVYGINTIKSIINSSFVLKNKHIRVFRNNYNVRLFTNKIIVDSNPINSLIYNMFSFMYVYKKYKFLAFMRLFNMRNKKYILLSDRPNKASDNAEALFDFINKEEKELSKLTYFVISKSSEDYKELKKIGKVVRKDSLKHKYLFLNSKLICSSHLGRDFYSPFDNKNHKYYADMLNYKFIWLQHGITKDDISNAANKYAKGVDYLVCSTIAESNEFLKSKYFYSSENILLTGFTRFDRLNNLPHNIITIMPTWRSSLTGKIMRNGEHEIRKDFENSDYYNAYKQLLSNQGINKMLQEYKYKLQFILHPGMLGYQNYFKQFENDNINIIPPQNVNYREVFSKSKLLITDYSSVFFDFAYMKKPVIYYQFDRISFRKNHYNEGYFSYKEDGFGDVLETSDEVINKIEYYFNNNFKNEDKYIDRINKTFKYTDKNNCKRLVNHIKTIVNKGG